MELIIRNPTDQELARARAQDALRRDPLLRRKVDTLVSERMKQRAESSKPLSTERLEGLKLIPWEKVSAKLLALNKDIIFATLPDAKIAIGLKTPSRAAVKEWEDEPLSAADRREARALSQNQGPRNLIVAASRGWISPYTDLLTSSFPPQIVSRSLKSILERLIQHGAFSWTQAEREFGLRLRGPGTGTVREFVNIRPKVWAERPKLVI